jgi:hypothetical protein
MANAGDRELQARYPAHENLTDIAVASDGSAPRAAIAISTLDSIFFPFAIQTALHTYYEMTRIFLLAMPRRAEA